mgnify:CR=1 FL=1
MIQEAVNRAISSAAGALAVAKGIKAADRVAEERKAAEESKAKKEAEALAERRSKEAEAAAAKQAKEAERAKREKAKADEAKALREKKEKQDELLADKRGLDAAPQAMKAASQLEESLGEESELRKRSEEIEGKISIRAQRLEKDKNLTRRQQGGYKGYITKMQRAQEAVREKLEAREFQSELMAKRLEILKRMHGDAWARMGFDPTKKGGKL